MAAGVYSVTQVNSYIRNMFTQDFLMNRLTVKGEVSNCKYHGSGHIYFTLKDEGATLAAVMFAGNRKGLSFHLENGQKVLVTGSVNVYERDGKYQLYAGSIQLDGEGDLYRRFEKLKKELEEMGMFDQSYKQKIPRFSSRIGIVTAPTGAAIQDIINISRRRNPYVQLILYPAVVQGAQAPDSICRGILALERQKVDVIIVGRGGGSIEDLWAFNEEIVARAIFNCTIPVISAVGHETDFTIADFVADLRAPTPSAAAELAVADRTELEGTLNMYRAELDKDMRHAVEQAKKHMEFLDMRLRYQNPVNILNNKRQDLSYMQEQLEKLMQEKLTQKRHTLMLQAEKLNGLSPLLKLQQGYSYTQDEDGHPVCDISQVKKGTHIKINVKNGMIRAVVEDTIPENTLK
jgi:exodeoxyribonuclease VII large subunit